MALPVRHFIEYAGFRVLAGMLCVLPYRGALAVGWLVAWLGFYVIRFRVDAAVQRILSVFPQRYDVKSAHRVAWFSWRNFIFTGVEMIRIPVSRTKLVKQTVRVGADITPLLNHLKSGQGAIVATLHMGSWEMASLACLAYGVPLFSLAAPQKNKLIDQYLNQARAASGFETLLRTDSVLKNIVRQIKAGKVLAILPDVRSKTPALPINFLGQTMNVAGGMGLLARLTQVPVFPVIITRKGWGEHFYYIYPAIKSDPARDKKDDILRITQEVFNVYDQAVRQAPEQWFWFNKRWVFDPIGEEFSGEQIRRSDGNNENAQKGAII